MARGLHQGVRHDGCAGNLPRLIGPATRLLSLQNGLGNAETLLAFAERSRIAIGMTTVPADLVAPGEVRSHGEGMVRMTMLEGNDAPLRELAAALRAAGLACTVDPATHAAIWEKVAFNVALNGLCALTRRTVGELGAHREGRGLAHAIATEVLDVARREGLAVSGERTRAAIDHALDHHGQHEPSMLRDLRAGRRTEIETLNGAVMRAARRHGVPVPHTAALHALVKMREEDALADRGES